MVSPVTVLLALGAEVSELIALKLPSDVVEESARASVTVLGEFIP